MAIEEKDDRDIIEEAKEDEGLFGLIYLKYFKKLYTFIWFRVGKSAKTAEDLAQETFLRAFKHLKGFKRTSASYLSYLIKIAKNLLVSYYRKKKPIPLETLESEPAVETISSVENQMDAKARLANIAHLSVDYQTLLKLRYVERLSFAQIADKLGKSENAVKVSLHRARKAARKTSTPKNK